MTHSDKELLERIKNGSQSAFKELYLKYSDLLFAFILHQIEGNKEVTSDIWQETWIIAVEHIPDFQYRCSFFTWLCSIAKNKISDYYRLETRYRKIAEEIKVSIDIENEEIVIEDDKIRVDVISVLGELSDEYRNILTSRYFENKSVDEISQANGKSYKATESLLSRSREAFRVKFNKIYNSKI